MIQKAIEISKRNDCYWIVGNSSKENINFYYKCGF